MLIAPHHLLFDNTFTQNLLLLQADNVAISQVQRLQLFV